jgi:glycosyltransferase involved in cell wall biosynthesis
MDPRVTVLMPVYNGGATLTAAVHSVLDQTYEDLELLVIDDGSTDATPEIVRGFRDGRIRVERDPENLGLPRSLNKGLAMARGEYIARMDADDISLPRRLERQVAFMDEHPEIGASGTWARTIGHGAGRIWRRPIGQDDATATLLFGTPFIHPSVILRRDAFVERGLTYDPALEYAAEDWDLWMRASEHMRLANLPEVLVLYHVRVPPVAGDPHAHDRLARKRDDLLEVIARSLRRLGISATAEDLRMHAAICLIRPLEEPLFLQRAEGWLLRLLSINVTARVYPHAALARQIAMQWFAICYACSRQGRPAWGRYWRSPLAKAHAPSAPQIVRFALSALAAMPARRSFLERP